MTKSARTVEEYLLAIAGVTSKGELTVVPPPTLAQLAVEINADYEDLIRATQSAVEKAINIGKRLNVAKKQTSHGEFSGYVTSNFRFTMRWAQQCMKLANHEPEIRQQIEKMRSISSHLSLVQAVKLIDSLNPKPKLKRKKPKAAN